VWLSKCVRRLLRTGQEVKPGDWLALSEIAALLIAACVLVHEEPTEASGNVGNGSSWAGRRMFFGETPLQGIIVGHEHALPPEVVGCANCHLGASRATADGSFAPRLGRSTMTESRRRRGGPPSQFSAASFCRLLRTGVDPAYIIISRQMPRYMLDDGQRLDLWQYLLEQSDEPSKEQQ
jgi:hypothetical protein